MNSTKNKSTSLTQKKLISFSKKKLSKIPLIKKMITDKKNVAGKNNFGKITVRHKGGGHQKKI
jgi:ribosomal protein L2